MTGTLHVICGHGAGDPGACSGGYSEAERVRALAKRMAALGGGRVSVLDTSRNWYADGGINGLSIPSGDWLIELHMDSASASARGGHVVVYAGFEPDAQDRALAAFVSGFFPGRSETIAKRSDLANPYRAARRGINYRLLECCFISNAGDLARFNGSMDAVAQGILAAFGIDTEGEWLDMATKEDVAEAVWGHGINGHTAGERLYLCNKMDYDKSDPTGRGMELTTHDHVKHIAKAVAELSQAVGELSAKVDALGGQGELAGEA